MTKPSPIPAAAPLIGDEERAAVDRVMRSGMIAGGPEVEAFETEFSRHVDGYECVAVNSGTSALHLGLLAAGIQPGDEVIVPSFTFAATANAVALAGGTPVFVDIDPNTFCIDASAVRDAITPKTIGIMPVHLYGHPAAMSELQAVADTHGISIFEDAAQAHDASLDGKPVGTFGAFAAFSFYPTKNMTSGEGGMVVTADSSLAHRVRLLRNQGMQRRYENEIVGFNARMTDIHAAIGRVQLNKLPVWTERRRENAKRFDSELRGVTVPTEAPGAHHVYHQYTIRVEAPKRGDVVSRLADRGVGTGVYYPTPVHRLPSFGLAVDLPHTTQAAAEVLSLPVHPSLQSADIDRIIDAVNTLAGDNR